MKLLYENPRNRVKYRYNLGGGLMIKRPKICIPIVATNYDKLIEEVELIIGMKPDLIEWRVDQYLSSLEIEKLTLEALKLELIKPLLYISNLLEHEGIAMILTIRGKSEGGFVDLDDTVRMMLILWGISQCKIQYVDLELDLYDHSEETEKDEVLSQLFKDIVNEARTKNIKVILSNHDFTKTPSFSDMIAIIKRAQRLRADLVKIAYMPSSSEDVLSILAACQYGSTVLNQKMIALSMGEIGRISRIIGGEFGSEVTFARGVVASAPGQMTIEAMNRSWDTILMDEIPKL